MDETHRWPPPHSDDDTDDDDINIYVSPKRFVGRTPSPRATRQRVFEEEQEYAHRIHCPNSPKIEQDSGIPLDIENLEYVTSQQYDCKCIMLSFLLCRPNGNGVSR